MPSLSEGLLIRPAAEGRPPQPAQLPKRPAPAHLRPVPVAEDPVFEEPWEAQVFALVLALQERGLFSWAEWSEALGVATRAAAGPARGVYDHWLAALETLLAARKVAPKAAVDARAEAYARLLAEKPHAEAAAIDGAARAKAPAKGPAGGFVLDAKLAEDTVGVADLKLCRVLLMDDARYSWLVLVPRRPDITEVTDLTEADAATLMAEARRVTAALKAAVPNDKINLGALGNLVPQFHLHVVARRKGDEAWPGPVWGAGKRVPYDAAARTILASRLAAALKGEPPRA